MTLLMEKNIYEVIKKETSGKFDRALTNLQRNLFITMLNPEAEEKVIKKFIV